MGLFGKKKEVLKERIYQCAECGNVETSRLPESSPLIAAVKECPNCGATAMKAKN